MRVVLYAYALAYLVAPETFSSANVIDTIAALPESVKYAGKAILAAPFAFHSWNGIRHLSCDVGNCEYVRFFRILAVPTYYNPSLCQFLSPQHQGRVLVRLHSLRRHSRLHCCSSPHVNAARSMITFVDRNVHNPVKNVTLGLTPVCVCVQPPNQLVDLQPSPTSTDSPLRASLQRVFCHRFSHAYYPRYLGLIGRSWWEEGSRRPKLALDYLALLASHYRSSAQVPQILKCRETLTLFCQRTLARSERRRRSRHREEPVRRPYGYGNRP